ncbi:hypothetical protein ACWCQP_44890 [Streptomyces chartreusis]
MEPAQPAQKTFGRQFHLEQRGFLVHGQEEHGGLPVAGGALAQGLEQRLLRADLDQYQPALADRPLDTVDRALHRIVLENQNGAAPWSAGP